MEKVTLVKVSKIEILFNKKGFKERHSRCLKNRIGVLSKIATFDDGDTVFYGKQGYTSDGWDRKAKKNLEGKTSYLLCNHKEYIYVGLLPGNKGLILTTAVHLLCLGFKSCTKTDAIFIPPGNYVTYIYLDKPRAPRSVLEARLTVFGSKLSSSGEDLLQKRRLVNYLKKNPGGSVSFPETAFEFKT